MRLSKRVPCTYADNSVDILVAEEWGAQQDSGADGANWEWPEGKQCALVLSHDVDTAGQDDGVRRLARVASRRGYSATISFVGDNLTSYRALIEEVSADGHEIALHDMFHDNTVAFLSPEAVLVRLAPLQEQLASYKIRGFRSPSWYTSAALWEALPKAGFEYDMSVLDSWPFFEQSKNYGVATLFPFMVNNLVILPNTIPYDDTPTFCGYRTDQVLAFWKPKFEWIARNRGLIMLNAHPDRWWSGTKNAAAAYDRAVDYVMEKYDPACMTAGQVRDHFLKQKQQGGTVQLQGTPQVHVPRPGAEAPSSSETLRNPILMLPEEFLR